MRKLFYAILILTAIVAAGSCDRKGVQLDNTFDRADALMHDHPDSALAIMQSVDTTGLSRQRLARYALLMTTALDKNYIEPENESLIKIALDYYCGQNNFQEIGALYYYGQIHYTNKSIDIALPILDMSYEMAMKNQNWYYAGMSARLLSDIYDKQLQFPLQFKYALLAKSAYQKYENENNIDDHRYSIWMDTSISEYFVNTDQYERCIQFCDSLEATEQEQSVSYYEFISINKAQAYCRIGEPEKSIHIYDSLINSGYEMEGYNWNRLSEFYFLNNEFDKSRIALDSAKSHTYYDQDKLYISYLEDLLSSNSDDKDKTIAALKNFNRNIIDHHNKYVTSSPFPQLIDSYNKRSEEYKQHIRKQKFRLYTSLAIAFAIIVCGAIFFARRIRLKKREIISLNEKKVGMDETIEKLMGELSALSTLISEEKLKNSTSIENQNKILVSHLKDIDSLCSLVYTASGTETKDNRIIKNIRKSITSETSLTNIDEAIDAVSDGFIDTIILNFPRMQRSRLRLVRYLFCGFSFETMMTLFNYNPENRNNLDSAKSNLKRQITNKKDWVGTTEKTVLHKLNFK